MKTFLVTTLASIIFCGFIYNQDKPFKQLHALEGKWIMQSKKGTFGEQWSKINDAHMQGKGFYLKGADTVITESVALKETAEGIFYTPTVADQNNKKPVSFKLTSSDNNVFVFENAKHDFPKRIVYQLVNPDSLYAYIDGGAAMSEGKREDFFYSKVK